MRDVEMLKLDPRKIAATRKRVKKSISQRRHGSRIDDGMWVATIAAMLMVFAAGVFVGWAFA